jgi:hypothetical protein
VRVFQAAGHRAAGTLSPRHTRAIIHWHFNSLAFKFTGTSYNSLAFFAIIHQPIKASVRVCQVAGNRAAGSGGGVVVSGVGSGARAVAAGPGTPFDLRLGSGGGGGGGGGGGAVLCRGGGSVYDLRVLAYPLPAAAAAVADGGGDAAAGAGAERVVREAGPEGIENGVGLVMAVTGGEAGDEVVVIVYLQVQDDCLPIIVCVYLPIIACVPPYHSVCASLS